MSVDLERSAFYPLTVREDSKLTVIRPGGARGLHRPGEEVAVNRDKNKLSMASALIWKEEVVTERNLGNITSLDKSHATGPDTGGKNSAGWQA